MYALRCAHALRSHYDPPKDTTPRPILDLRLSSTASETANHQSISQSMSDAMTIFYLGLLADYCKTVVRVIDEVTSSPERS